MLLPQHLLEQVLDAALSGGADFAEVFVENSFTNNMEFSMGRPHSAVTGRLSGAGIYLMRGTETIYTYTNDLNEKSLVELARTAAAGLKGGTPHQAHPLTERAFDSIHAYGAMPWEIPVEKKWNYLRELDRAGRARSSLVTQVLGALIEKNQKVLIANSEGLLLQDERNYSRLAVSCVAEREGMIESGSERDGALGTGEYFEALPLAHLAEKAADQALTLLDAELAPAGEFPVVLERGFGGVIFHEACGHGLETTSVAKNASVFCEKLGQKIASDCVTAIDDGTMSGFWGSIDVDDEGLPTQETVLIENGILKSYLVDRLGARKTGYTPTGSGRRQSYRFAPTSRMRNTYIAAGDATLEELIGDVDYGIYAKKMGGGSVSPGTGAYNFAVDEAYLIEKGRITRPVKGASLIGTGIETLGRITKVGKDLELSTGMCGSVSGWVPVTVGQPPLLVSKLTVGGASA